MHWRSTLVLLTVSSALVSGLECLQSGNPSAALITPLSSPSYLSCVTLTTPCSPDTNLLFSDFVNPPSTPPNFTISGNVSAGANGLSIAGIKGAGAAVQPLMLCAFEDVVKQRNQTLFTGYSLACPDLLASFSKIVAGILGPYATSPLGTTANLIGIHCCGTDDCNLGIGGMYANGTLFYPGGGVVLVPFQPPSSNQSGIGTTKAPLPPVQVSDALDLKGNTLHMYAVGLSICALLSV